MPDEPVGFGITHDEDVQVVVDFGAAEGTYDVTVRRSGEAVEKLEGLTHETFQARLHASAHVDVHGTDVPAAPPPAEEEAPPTGPPDAAPPPPPTDRPAAPQPPAPAPAPADDSPMAGMFAWLRKIWARLTGT